MKKRMIFSVIAAAAVSLSLLMTGMKTVRAEGIELTSPSAILMEASTGTVIYEKDADMIRSPASITKIMTAILIFDALNSGQISLEDEVAASAYAKSMTGSKVFLEEGEKQTVDTLIKCIMVASGNDASVVMAEYISGSEAVFVEKMNERARGMGLENTHFCDCSGLSDSDDHYTTARDVAIMARELINTYPEIFDYSTIWMENITHVTVRGSSEFGLANTNKLLRQYQYTTGLKTGSTDKAKYCLCATASKDDVNLIAVVMGCPDYRARFPEAATLFNYGYSVCRLYRDKEPPYPGQIYVKGGVKEYADTGYNEEFSYLSLSREVFSEVEKRLELNELEAPVRKGDVAGQLEYSIRGKIIGHIPVYVQEDIDKAGYIDYVVRLFRKWMDG